LLFVLGRKMTPKEAFRYQCRIFHGIQPSQNKIEKQIVKEKLKEKIESIDQIGDSKLMQALNKVQDNNKSYFMVLDTKNPTIL
jgi:U4/U6.U5 tri-snRNP-associated protein 1